MSRQWRSLLFSETRHFQRKMSASKRPDPPDDEVPHWEELGSELVADCRIFDVVSKRFRHPSRETEGDFYVIRTRDWVNVIPYHLEFRNGIGKSIPIWSSEEFMGNSRRRYGIRRRSCRRGFRELQEETGFTSERARLLGSVRPNPAIQNNACHIVLAEKASKTADLRWDEHEEINENCTNRTRFLIWFSLARSFTPWC